MKKDIVYVVVGNTTGHGFEKYSLVIGTGKSGYTEKGFWFIGESFPQIISADNVIEIGSL